MEELSLCLYTQIKWENYSGMMKKLKVMKNEKKDEEKKAQKMK